MSINTIQGLEKYFDSDRKRMSVVVTSRKGEIFLFTKGAPDVILPLCTNMEIRQIHLDY